MKWNWIRAAAATISAALFLSVSASALPAVSADSAVLMDGLTGRILFEKNPDRQSRIASTTKIMTALVVLETCDPDQVVTIGQETVGIEGSSLYLKAGEQMTIEQLLYGLMLSSGNDAAATLAIAAAGSIESFAEKMNEKAQQLGLTRTRFVNPHGLDAEGHFGTARDLAVLTRYAMEREDFRKIVATKTYEIGPRQLINHNKLLWRYEGAEGVKTGYTKKAGRILVSAAERGGRRLIAVTIGAPDDWNDHTAMLDYGFSSMRACDLVSSGEALGTVSLVGCQKPECTVLASEAFSLWMAEEERAELVLHVPHVCYGPVTGGQLAGWAEVRIDGESAGRVPLIWAESVIRQQIAEKRVWKK